LVTDASGYASIAVVDAGTSGTTDTLTFTDGSATKSLTITYGTTTVTTMTLTGGNTTAGVTSTTKTAKDIAADTAGAAAGVQTITATLKDANGALMNGVPVTWSVAGTTASILSTQVTKYSGSVGTATTSVYAWAAGNYVVTATAGGVTATAEVTFAQNTAAEARTLSATVSGQVVTAKVVDRFGNPVLGVNVYASKVSGTGYFGGGVSKVTVATGADGIAEFAIAGGDAVHVAVLHVLSKPTPKILFVVKTELAPDACQNSASASVVFVVVDVLERVIIALSDCEALTKLKTKIVGVIFESALTDGKI
jgi:hypothetical protein